MIPPPTSPGFAAASLASIPRIVLDTNVLVTGLRSQRGASFAILELVDRELVLPVLSVPLFLEYEEVLKRPGLLPHLDTAKVDDFLDYFATRSVKRRVTPRWRPFLIDPDDDMLVEVALAGRASHIVTANVRHLAPVRSLGLNVLSPGQFLTIAKP